MTIMAIRYHTNNNKRTMILFLKEHSDTIKTLALGGGGFTAVSFSVDIFFKVLIGSATLYYLYLKIRKEKKDGKH